MPGQDLLQNTSDKWSTLVMMVLGQEKTLRFNELKTVVSGISQKMLTVTLKNLERYGLVNGSAKFEPLEGPLVLNIKGDGLGHFELDCEATPEPHLVQTLSFQSASTRHKSKSMLGSLIKSQRSIRLTEISKSKTSKAAANIDAWR